MKQTEEEKEASKVRPQISPEMFRDAYKTVTEKTSSSLTSKLHYTLWKAVAEDEDMCAYYAVMMSLPFQYGFAHPRWTREIDCMLEKTAGERKIHLLQIIGIVKGDLNQALKILFHTATNEERRENRDDPDQWGGRSNRSAPNCASRKLLTFEYKRYMKSTQYHHSSLSKLF